MRFWSTRRFSLELKLWINSGLQMIVVAHFLKRRKFICFFFRNCSTVSLQRLLLSCVKESELTTRRVCRWLRQRQPLRINISRYVWKPEIHFFWLYNPHSRLFLLRCAPILLCNPLGTPWRRGALLNFLRPFLTTLSFQFSHAFWSIFEFWRHNLAIFSGVTRP